MSDIAKWALLVAGVLALIAAVLALPIMEGISPSGFASAVASVVSIAGGALRFGRGLVNNFVLPWARPVVSVVIWWSISKWVLTIGIRIGSWVYRWIFK